MSVRNLLMVFFAVYGAIIPWTDFASQYLRVAVAMVGICGLLVLAFLLERAVLINVVLAVYLFLVYLTRPFVSVFEPYLSRGQLDYIELNAYFFNYPDATIVYWNLLLLLAAWVIGSNLFSPPSDDHQPPRLFKAVDDAITQGGAAFWVAFALLAYMNYKDVTASLESARTGEGEGSFLWGMASLHALTIACLYAFMTERPRRWALLAPAGIYVVAATIGGARSAVFLVAVFAGCYWLFMNHRRFVPFVRLTKGAILGAALTSVMVVVALFVQVIRPLYRTGADTERIADALNPDVVLAADQALYFGITELLHRLSALKAPFLILNEHYLHDPWTYYNPIEAIKRIVNDLLPASLDPFDVLSIVQVFDFIYHDSILNYSSEMWSIQGTLYLHFGWAAPLVVLGLAAMSPPVVHWMETIVRKSPTSASVTVLFLHMLFNNGTAEWLFRFYIVQPLVSLAVFIFLMRVLRGFSLPTLAYHR